MNIETNKTSNDLAELKQELPSELNNNLAYKEELKKLPDVIQLTNKIDVNDMNTILSFGQEPSSLISKVSDDMLNSLKAIQTKEVSEMIVQLTKLMDKFDIKEIESNPEARNLLQKIFSKMQDSLEDMFKKYDNMGTEVDKIGNILTKYKIDIAKTNDNLSKLLQANINYFRELEKYIAAGELGVKEIEDYIFNLSQNNNGNEQEKQMLIQQLDTSKQMLQQRVVDLQIAENVAMQSCPMIMTMQTANANLIRKINSSFIVTLPIFKQCLAQAIMLKRQEIESKSIKALDDKTNELLLRNAQNTANQSAIIARQAGGSSISIETLKSTYETIKNGIEETKRINEELSQKRTQDSAELENMKAEMKKKGFA